MPREMETEDDALTQQLQRAHFFKKTRRGKVIRLVKEKYLQRNVALGFMGSNVVLPESLLQLVSQAPHKHILILDTNVCINDIDLFEMKCPATSLIVVLQTVLQEVRHIDVSVYRRLMLLIKDESRNYIFCPNEVAAEVATQRLRGESDNDFNDRLIRLSAAMYAEVIHSHAEADETLCGCQAFMISNDVDNRRRAEKEDIPCMSIHAYVRKYLREYPELLDVLSATSTDEAPAAGGGPARSFPPHVPMNDILSGLRTRKYFRCTVRCSGRPSAGVESWKSCYAIVHKADGSRVSVAIEGEDNVNRALDGDVVAIEILDRDEADTAASRGADEETPYGVGEVGSSTAEASSFQIEGLSAPGGEEVDKDTAAARKPVYLQSQERGRVVGIIRRNWRQYAGSLVPLDSIKGVKGADTSADTELSLDTVYSSDAATERALFIPLDHKLPRVLVNTRRLEELILCRVLVSIDSWPANSAYPIGHFVRSFGATGVKDVETSVLLHEFEVPYESFSPAVMACLPPTDWKITEEIIAQRTDLRHIPVVSIDPPGCKDIDDALHCCRLPNGNLEVGVHIADVGYFVDSGSAVDIEAQHRSTSTYLVERRLDMLPGYLTTQLCSLRSNEDHLAFSVIWEMDEDANIIDVSYCKSCIHSVASLTYDEAQAMLDDPSRDDQVSSSVRLLNMLAVKLRQRRRDAGALTLASTEVRFKLDAETQDPTDVAAYNLKASNALVEEWMLIANITVAKKVLRHYPTLGILRRHQPPSRTQFTSLLEAARAVGIELNIDSSKTLADSLDRAVRPGDVNFNKLLRILSTRCMMPAQYFCSGELPKDQWHHYGLATPVYTHFTSPIRRYADLLVHRLLAAAISVTSLPVANADRARQHDICAHMNRRHRAAQHIQRASVNLHSVLFFSQNPTIEPAYILSVLKDHITVIAPKYGIESVISVQVVVDYLKKRSGNKAADINSDWLQYDNKACSLTLLHSDVNGDAAQKKKKTTSAGALVPFHEFKVFDKVSVYISVLRACPEEGRPTSTLMVNLILDGKVFYEKSWSNIADVVKQNSLKSSAAPAETNAAMDISSEGSDEEEEEGVTPAPVKGSSRILKAPLNVQKSKIVIKTPNKRKLDDANSKVAATKSASKRAKK